MKSKMRPPPSYFTLTESEQVAVDAYLQTYKEYQKHLLRASTYEDWKKPFMMCAYEHSRISRQFHRDLEIRWVDVPKLIADELVKENITPLSKCYMAEYCSDYIKELLME